MTESNEIGSGRWGEIVTVLNMLNERTRDVTPQELIAEIRMLAEHASAVSASLSNAFDATAEDDKDSLALDQAERLISGIQVDIENAREQLLIYLGARTLEAQLEKPGTASVV